MPQRKRKKEEKRDGSFDVIRLWVQIAHYIHCLQDAEKLRLSTAIFSSDKDSDKIWRMPSGKLEQYQTQPSKLFQRLNYSSLLYLSSIDDDFKRAFYEQEAIAME